MCKPVLKIYLLAGSWMNKCTTTFLSFTPVHTTISRKVTIIGIYSSSSISMNANFSTFIALPQPL